MWLAARQVILKVPLFLLGLWMLLAPVQCSQGHPSWRYVSSEVVIPRKETHLGKGVQVPGWLSYSLRFGGQKHVIHMRRKKLLWPRHMLVTTQDDQGALQMDYPYIPPDCYYLGYLEEIPLSMVTIDTCYGGLEGIMKLDDLAYEIRPLKDSHRFEHVVSQIVAESNATGPMFRPGHKEETDLFSSAADLSEEPRLSSRLYSAHAGTLRGQVQCSRSIYLLFNNITKCAKYAISMFSLVDSFFQVLRIKYYIYILTIYDRADPVAINDRRVPGSPIHNYFLQTFFRTIHPDSSVFLEKTGLHEANFEPVARSLCNERSLVFTTQFGRHYFLLAIIAANQIGRSFGLDYDAENMCECQRRTSCIMFRFPGLTDAFSNCSFVHTQNIYNQRTSCIYHENIVYLNKSITETRCGNLEVDPAEQCDCGSFKQCYSNPCCKSDCRFTPGSVCDKGTCCTNCSYAASGTLCRAIHSVCDLPEYCLGSTAACPDDLYMQDGTPCTQEGFCYKGNCTDRTLHCRELFGAHALDADQACYGINTGTFRFGHCRRVAESREFLSCENIDKMCGRLQCMNVTHLPRLQEHVSFHQTLIEGFTCFGLDEHRGTETTDAGRVKNGAPCAPGKFCSNTYCNGSVTAMNYDCFPDKCNRRGICNNKRNCHCHIGWEPPLCRNPGAGGSADGGHPPKKVRSVTQSQESVFYVRVVFGRIYALIGALLFGVATNVRTIKTVKVTEAPKPEQE
ncbi:disintegrin and metalloproteinase domain-containing protein 21 [Tupaia chinensis]|uniref:Disintegrin and metalloproteinase domain-containing protein 20 n=1 Tax=Tupaia chinensis TaxID=246437 RepID=L9KGH5_TUPCH|nr:disintegrin and metalloproteinase domain-containing protein 21 [Tupaia chinensis]ELW61559.1 Disintegrin and metalloproteinase domain-containing protein 20 [Tupaia chinensis]